jgi:dihydroorotate dehydrogenase
LLQNGAMIASAATSLLRRLEPEQAHSLALRGLRWGLAGRMVPDPRLAVRTLGLDFSWPVGLAAGFDKDAVALEALMRLGFGAVEAGTVTPRPQPGNPRPRLFRLEANHAIINRMGFNSGGLSAFASRFGRAPRIAPLGANIGPNQAGAEPLRDFPALAQAVAPRADWITLNVSSPNTPGLRDLQTPRMLADILMAIRRDLPTCPPLLVKLSPDIERADLADIVEACVASGAAGLIVSNTTLARPPELVGPHVAQAGGLSGRPLMQRSTAMLERVARLAAGRLVLVGAGGVRSAQDVLEKLRAGASLVQIYTAFVYEGPALLRRLERDLLSALDVAGVDDLSSLVGSRP